MDAPKYIQDGLRANDSMYFAVFNPNIEEPKNMSHGKGRWQVRKWNGVYPKRLDLWDIDSEVIMTLCKEAYSEDKGLYDAGYEEIDGRVITAIGRSNYWKADYKRKIVEMDWKNERMERQAEAQLEYESRYAARRIWRSLREPTVHLSGKEWKV